MMPYRITNQNDDAIQFLFDTKAGEVMVTVAHVVDDEDDGATNVSLVVVNPDGRVFETTAHATQDEPWHTHEWQTLKLPGRPV